VCVYEKRTNDEEWMLTRTGRDDYERTRERNEILKLVFSINDLLELEPGAKITLC